MAVQRFCSQSLPYVILFWLRFRHLFSVSMRSNLVDNEAMPTSTT
jgi:hypothetical protein